MFLFIKVLVLLTPNMKMKAKAVSFSLGTRVIADAKNSILTNVNHIFRENGHQQRNTLRSEDLISARNLHYYSSR